MGAFDLPSQPQPPPGMGELLAQAQRMQEQLMEARAAAEEQEVEGQSGGGVVRVKVTGGMEFRSVKIDPSAVDPADVEMLEDLVLAAIHDATHKVQELTQEGMGQLGLGGLGGLLG